MSGVSRSRRQRFAQFPRGHRAGALAVSAMLLAALCAVGLPGHASGESPAENWMQLHEQNRIELNSIVTIANGDESEDPALIESIEKDKSSTAARAKRGQHPLKSIDFRAMARRAAVTAGIKRPGLFVRQIAAESGMQPCAVSGAGAIGIAQIMPSTARSWHVDPWSPDLALAAAAQHMARYERQYGSYSLALAAYNAGPGSVKSFGGIPPYAQTRDYVSKIMKVSTPLAGMRQTFVIPQRLTPGFSGRLRALLADVRAHDMNFAVVEGWRSYEESARVWNVVKQRRGGWENAIKWAAPPGCSNHVRGLAADLIGSKAALAKASELAPKHGLIFPMSYEPWHVELDGIKTQSH